MSYPKRYVKKGVNLVYFRPRVLLSYLPEDLKVAVCASLEVDSLDDDKLVFDYDPIQDCYSISKSFECIVSVKNEVDNA